MFKILIADDNALIRMGLKSMIDFEALGATLIGEAKNGEEAYRLLEEKQPDLLITDIRMPGKDGLFLLDKIRSEFPKTDTIVISAYDDFDYAKQAIMSGSINYILKPIDPDELNKSLMQAYNRYVKEKGMIGISIDQKDNQMVYVIKSRPKLDAAVLTQKLSVSGDYELIEEEDLFYFICQKSGENSKRILDTINSMSVKVLCGSCRLDVYETMQECIKMAVINACNMMFEKYDRKLNDESQGNQVPEDDIILLIKSGNYPLIERHFSKFFDKSIKDAAGDFLSFAKQINAYLRLLFQLEDEHYIKVRDIMERIDSQLDKLSYLDLNEIYDEISKANKEICESYQRASGSIRDLVEKVKRLIDTNYEKNISLSYIAGLFSISEPYLSKVFKKETGININAYITAVRMEKAKYLLENTDKKIVEIARMVGYEEQNYFTKVFKKYAGKSPSECRG